MWEARLLQWLLTLLLCLLLLCLLRLGRDDRAACHGGGLVGQVSQDRLMSLDVVLPYE